jgi:putative glutamine amidotransferase
MRKPVIGLIPLVDEGRESFWMLPGYMEGISRAGGLGVMLPLTGKDEDIEVLLERFDGFLFTGGHDVEPAMYGQKKLPVCADTCPGRDEMEKKLLTAALEADKPVLGICRGLQLMNAVLGGTLWQDIPTQFPTEVNHRMEAPYGREEHMVTFTEELPNLPQTIGVNSCHHQGIRNLAPALKAWAVSADGLVEAAYLPDKKFARAVQWHPEFFSAGNDLSEYIFRSFVEAAR